MNSKSIICINLIVNTLMFSSCAGTEIPQSKRGVTASEASSAETSENDSDTVIISISNDSSDEQPVVTEIVTEAEQTTSSEITTTIEERSLIENTPSNQSEPSFSKSDISSRINEVFLPISNSGAAYSAKIMSVDDSFSFNVGNYNSRMVSASLIKLYVAGTVYEHLDSMKVYETYSEETEDLVNSMISQSDNNSCNALVTRLGDGDPTIGMNAVNTFCQSHGYYNTEMNRLMLDFNGLENYTTPEDCCKILKSYYQNELSGSKKIIEFMKNQRTRTKIPAGITDGTIVANKTGELASVENDSAIVYADSGAYIMCVMTNNLSDTAAARNAIAVASKIIYDYISN